MKLSILLAGSILTSAIVGNVYAQTCGAQPSCSSLGYTYTGSTSDCLSPALKCPFNTSYFNCVKKADVIKNMVLDWSKKKLINPTSSRYYVTSYGIIIGHLQDITNRGGTVTINGFLCQPDRNTRYAYYFSILKSVRGIMLRHLEEIPSFTSFLIRIFNTKNPHRAGFFR